jgi:alkaline phosphatase D
LAMRQKEWLKRALAASDAVCVFIVSSVNFMIPHVVDVGERGFTGYIDSWPAFWSEREELIGLFDALGKPVFILTGDLHNSFVIKVTDRVWEFASAPHSSGNADMMSEGRRPPNGEFDSNGRKCSIRWSTWFDNPFARRARPAKVYCVARVNNVFPNPSETKPDRWQAYPHPQVTFQYFDGLSGRLLYAESVVPD